MTQKLMRQTVAENITRKRTLAGLTQYELAEMIGMKQSAVARIESTGPDMRVETLVRFAKALQATPGELLDYEN